MYEASTIRVFLVDDHPVVREGLRALLAGEADLDVVEEASDAHEALEGLGRVQPDVVILDLILPGMGGAELVRAVLDQSPRTQVLVLSSFHRGEEIRACFEAGASGYVVKDTVDEELIAAVRRVAGGGTYVSPTAAISLAEVSCWERLTPRERQVLELMAQGYGNRAIARRLDLTIGTVKNYVHIVLAKLGATSRTMAVTEAFRRGLIPLS